MKLLKRPQYHKPLIFATAFLCLVGMVSLFSAALSVLDSQVAFYRTLIMQIVSLLIGAGLVYAALYVKELDYRVLYKKSYAFYFFICAFIVQLLVFTPIGVTKNGATRWIDVGMITIQPSELFKIAMVLMLGFMIIRFRKEVHHPWYAIGIIGTLAGVFFSIMILIRDMGTFVITCMACLAVLVVSRVRIKYTLGILVFASICVASFLLFAPQGGYIRDRLASHINLDSDPQGSGFQINQSVMTIGAGQITGRGFGESLQKHRYLPEPLTDSIFAVFGEEWGFLGSMLMLFLYLVLFYYGLRVALDTRDEYGRYIAVGLTVLILAQALYNIMAMLNLLPLSGMPLVFVSKGGSSLVTSLLIIAILINISRVTLTNRRVRKS